MAHGHSHRTVILGLAWNILYSPVNYICLGKFIEVSHTTADQTLKDEYIPLNCQGWSGRQISLPSLATIF